MDGTRLADRIAFSGGMAARKAGLICDAYRPRDGACPIVAANRLVRLGVLVLPVSGSVRGPAPLGLPYRQLVLDQAYVRGGDYVVGPAGTFLVVGNEPPAPALAARCNETLSIWRPAAPAVPGINPYGAVLGAGAQGVLAGFPAALLSARGGRHGEAGLPDDTRAPGYVAAVAAVDGLSPEVADIVRDARGRQFVIDQAELFGGVWRLVLSASIV